MVRCLTDFSCWEIIAKLAPLGTALIVLIAAIIALGAMWVQMHIARRRASIDFFLKTEIDKTVIDLYDKFKANAPSIAFVPDPSDLTRSDYDDIRDFLNICELIAVGVNNGAFSKSVSEAYWGDVISNAYQTAKQLISLLDDEEGLNAIYSRRKEAIFGIVTQSDERVTDLHFRDLTNKVVHAAGFDWVLTNPERPIIVCHTRNSSRWKRAEIEVIALMELVGGLGF